VIAISRAALVLAIGAAACNRGIAGDEARERPHANETPRTDERALVVTIDRNGVVVVAGRKLLLDDEIAATFDAYREQNPRGRIAFRAHRATLHGRLVRIVDLAKQSKLGFDVVIEE
jgi:biopolymer transport protein ExbD